MPPNTTEILKTILRPGVALTASIDTQSKSGLKGVYFSLNETTITPEAAQALLMMRASPGYQEPK